MENRREPAGHGPARTGTALLVGGVLATWLGAALLIWGLAPLVIAEPALAGTRRIADPGVVAELVRLFVPVGAGGGALILVALVLTWRRPLGVAGRVLLLVAGLLAGANGLLLGTIGFFEVGWGDGAALAGLAGATVFVAVGVSACVASLADWLPGASLTERMMAPSTVAPTRPAAERMLPLIVLLAAGWAICTSLVLSKRGLVPGEDDWMAAGFVAFVTAQMGLPILAGAIATGWREGAPNRLKTLGWASAARLVMAWLFLLALALALGQYYHNLDGTPYTPRSYVVWWGLMGGLLGACGYSLWGPLTRRQPLKQRSAVAVSATAVVPQAGTSYWLRFVIRMVVLLWGAVPLYFATASSLGGVTEPREVVTRLVVVGGSGSVLLLGLLLLVWRWERRAAWVLFGLAAVFGVYTVGTAVGGAISIGRGVMPPEFSVVVVVNLLIELVGLVLPPLVTGWLLLTCDQLIAGVRPRSARTVARALRVGFVLLGLTVVALLWLVIGNLSSVHEGWLRWVNYAFLGLLAATMGWQVRQAWTGSHADLARPAG